MASEIADRGFVKARDEVLLRNVEDWQRILEGDIRLVEIDVPKVSTLLRVPRSGLATHLSITLTVSGDASGTTITDGLPNSPKNIAQKASEADARTME